MNVIDWNFRRFKIIDFRADCNLGIELVIEWSCNWVLFLWQKNLIRASFNHIPLACSPIFPFWYYSLVIQTQWPGSFFSILKIFETHYLL